MALGYRTSMGKRGWRLFARDRSAATAVEFALLAPIFFAILTAILEMAIIFLSSQVLESAVNDTSRAIRTGEAQTSGWGLERFRQEVCNRSFGLIPDCSKLHIEVSEIGDFSGGNTTAPVDWNCKANCGWTRDETWSPGRTSSTVLVQVHYKYPVLLQIGAFGSANLPDGQRLIGAATVFRNEPF